MSDKDQQGEWDNAIPEAHKRDHYRQKNEFVSANSLSVL